MGLCITRLVCTIELSDASKLSVAVAAAVLWCCRRCANRLRQWTLPDLPLRRWPRHRSKQCIVFARMTLVDCSQYNTISKYLTCTLYAKTDNESNSRWLWTKTSSELRRADCCAPRKLLFTLRVSQLVYGLLYLSKAHIGLWFSVIV